MGLCKSINVRRFLLEERDTIKAPPPGHEFYGNQWTGGGGTATEVSLDRALGAYTENSPIRAKLTNGTPLDAVSQGMVNAIDSGMAPLPEDTVLYRGIKPIRSREMQQAIYGTTDRVLPGLEFSDRSYISTSRDLATALRFARGHEGAKGTVWVIHAKAGQNALDTGSKSARAEESEILLPRDSTLRILSVDYDSEHDVGIRHMEIV